MKTSEELQKELEDLQKQFKQAMDDSKEKMQKLEDHNKTLFKETKDAKKALSDYEQEQENKKQQKNKDEGNLQAQLDDAMKKIDQLKQENDNTLKKWSDEKLSNAALDVAVKAGAEKHNAELLARFVKDRLAFDNGDIKVTDENGNHTISKLDELVKEVANNERYSAFITATKANGGGATSQKNGVQADKKTITVNDYKEMLPADRNKFFAEGGRVVDNE